MSDFSLFSFRRYLPFFAFCVFLTFFINGSSFRLKAETLSGKAPARVRELLIIDSKVPDRQMFQNVVQEGTEIVMLREDQPAINQITEVLTKFSGLDAIHLVTHGSVGSIDMAGGTLNSNNLFQNKDILTGWGKALKQGGDFLFYGCNIAEGRAGKSFINGFAQIMGADVAASVDLTGANSKGGDWDLEYLIGTIESRSISVPNYQYTLQTPGDGLYTFQNATNSGNGTYTTTDGFFLITASNGSPTATSNEVSADEFGAYIPDGATNTSGTSYIQVAVKNGGSFKISSSVIGDYNISGSGSDNNFTNVYAVGYANNVQVAITPPHNSSIFEANYNLDFSSFAGKSIDAFRVYYTWGNGTMQSAFNLESITISGASTTAPLSSNNNLANLILSQGTLSPAFAAATTNYTSSVANSVTSLTLTPTVADATATVKVNGVAVTSGSASGAIALNVGSNTITVLVTAQDGSTKTYTLTVTRAAPAPPTVSNVTSSAANGTYKTGDVIAVNVAFTEVVTVTGTPQLTLETGTPDQTINYSSGSGTNTLTYNYTVQAGDLSADLDYTNTSALTLNGGTIKDAAGNNATLTLPGPGAANSLGANKALVIDGVAPAVSSINRTGSAQTNGRSVEFQVTFSENVTGVDNTDFTLTTTGTANGSVFSVAQVNASTYTVTVNAISGSGIIRLDLNNSGTSIQDVAGNAITTGYTSGQTYTIDQNAPSVISVGVPANATYGAGNNLDFTVNFGENIIVVGTPRIALTLNTGGTVYANYISGSGTSALTFRYTVTSGVADNDGITVGALELNGGTLKDAAGNNAILTLNSVGSTAGVLVDAAGPTSIILVADAALKAGETSTVTITFSEAVTGFTNADLTIANGTLSPLSSSDVGITWTATFTPTAGIADATNVITLDNTGVSDASGNAGSGSTNSNNYSIDTARPTATVLVADAALAIGETSLVTITFSEAVTGFTLADLTVENGTLTGLSSSDGGLTWTATFTPTANISDATNVITLDNTGVADAAGNAGSGTTDGNNYSIDSARPTATVVISDSALRIGETSQVTITFSEAVTGFTFADLMVANGTLTGLSSSDGGITWTATFTPNANISDFTNVITLDNTGVADAAGNAGSGTTDGNNYAIDTARPTATVVISDAALTIGETSLVTFTFSEAITGFTNADLTIANGTLSAVSSSDGGITWTATFTPNANISDPTNLITLDNTGVSDAAGNAGSGTTDGNNYAIDTAAPTLTITSNVSALKTGETATITFTFSEEPGATFGWDGTAGDVVVSGGTLSAISGSGLTRMAIFTPTANTNGGTASITVSGGSYSDASGNAGGAGSTPAITFDTQPPAAPSTPNLADASDSGRSNSDNITNVTTPVFSGTAEANSTVTLYDTDGTSVLGTSTANGGNWTITSSTLTSGAHTLTAKATDAAGNVSTASAGLSVTIDNTAPAASLVLTPANGATITTGTPVISGTAEANSIITVLIDGIPVNSSITVDGSGNWSYTTATLANGSHTITARATDIAGNTGALSSVNTISVNTNPTVNASAAFAELSTTYGTASASQTFTITATNLIEGILVAPPAGFEVSLNNSSFSSTLTLGGTDDVSSTTVYIRLTNTAAAGNHTGNVTLSSAGATTVNVPLPATNTVNKAALTITATGNNKVYEGTNTATVTLSDNRVADDVFTLAYTGATFNDKNAGVAKPITVSGITISGADAGNYTFNTTASTTAAITAKSLVVTATASDKVYDGNTTATVSLSDDRVTGDELVAVNSAANFDNKNAGSGKTVNISGITISGADAGNYTVNTTTTATAAITAKALAVTATASDKVYDGNTTATVILSDDRVTGDVLTVTQSTASFDNKNVGAAKTVSVSGITIGGADAGNYNANATVNTNASITKASLTITAENKEKIQGLPLPAFTATYTGFVNGESEAVLMTPLVFTTTADAMSPQGTYPITVGGTTAQNYNISFVSGTLTVKPGYPTGISVVASTLFENSAAGTLAGRLGSTSDDPSATFTYALVQGGGDTDNSLFIIQGQELKTASILDYEKKNNYSIRVRSTTQYGLYLDRTFQIALTDVNEAPTLAGVADETICYTAAPMTITMGGISPGPESEQSVILTITSDNADLFQQLQINEAGKVTYQVKSGQTGTANVTVTIQDNGGTANGGVDLASRTFKITVNPLPVVTILSDKGAVISKGETVQLTASGGTLYSWNNPGGVLSGQHSATITVRPAETTTYRVLVKTAAGCSEVKEFTIQVQDDYKVVNGTNLLSPNGDGVNDRFIIRNIDMYPNNTVKIFDRAGRLLYSKKNYTDEWDGTFQGSPLAEGTYYYIVDFGQRQLKGFITIVRN